MARRHYKTALGLNGFGWAHVVYDMPYSFARILKHAKKLGFDGVELFGIPKPYPEKKKEQRGLRRQVEDAGLRIASIQSLPGGLGNGHPASAYSMCRNDYVDFIEQSLELAATLGCDNIGVWAGERLGDGPNNLSIGNMVETYGRCAKLAKQAKIPLCLEAEPVQLVCSPAIWFKILRGVDSPYLKGICDFAHLNVFSKGKPLPLLRRLLPFVGHTHLAGNDGTCTKIESRSSTHLPLDEGTLNWKPVLSRLLDSGYKQWLDVDVWEHPDPFEASARSKRALDAFLSERK